MKIYGIAKKEGKVYGHGDFGEELVICQYGAYHSEGHFKPFFTSKEAAQIYLNRIEYNSDLEIVELELIQD